MRIVYTSDVHGYYYPTDYLDKELKNQGLLSIAKEYKEIEDKLIIDGGDILQGSAFAFLRAKEKDSKTAAEIMNDIGLDYLTLGNHDFNFGYDYLRDYLNHLQAKCICCNVVDEKGEINNLSSYEIVDWKGKKIGIIGAVTDWVNLWEKEENKKGFTINKAWPALKEAYKAIEDTDFKICIYHGGFEIDLDSEKIIDESDENIGGLIAKELDIDLLLTGHQHMSVCNRKVFNTHIVQPSSNALKYADIKIDLNKKSIESKLNSPTGLVDDRLYEKFLDKEMKTQEYLDQILARLPRDLMPESRLEMALNGSELADFINHIQKQVSGADISITTFANQVTGLNKNVTMRDVLNTYRYPNTLSVLKISGSDLKKAINKNYEYIIMEDGKPQINPGYIYPKLQHYNFDFFYGIEYELDFTKDFQDRLISLSKNGETIEDDDYLSIVMNNYRTTGVSGFDMYIGLEEVKVINIEVSQLIVDYLIENYK